MGKRVGKDTDTTHRTQALIALAERRGISQAELGRRVGRKRSIVNEWKAGRAEPDVQTFAKLCRALDLSVDDALGVAPERWFGRPEVEQAVVHLDEARRLLAVAQEAEAVSKLARAGEERVANESTRAKRGSG